MSWELGAINRPMRALRHASPLGAWELVLGTPHPALRGGVRQYQGYAETTSAPIRRREVPHGQAVLILNLGSPFRLSGPQNRGRWEHRGSFVAGLHDEVAFDESTGLARCLQVNLTPLGARRLLGVPMRELSNRIVDLDALLGHASDLLLETLDDAPTWARRFAVLERFLASRIAAAAPPAPTIVFAWRRLVASGGQQSIGALATEIGCSRKHLVARFHDEIGLTPKTLARVLRFERLVRLASRAPTPRWAELAAHCGYYDQAHLCRDFAALAGVTPVAFHESLLPNRGGVLG